MGRTKRTVNGPADPDTVSTKKNTTPQATGPTQTEGKLQSDGKKQQKEIDQKKNNNKSTSTQPTSTPSTSKSTTSNTQPTNTTQSMNKPTSTNVTKPTPQQPSKQPQQSQSTSKSTQSTSKVNGNDTQSKQQSKPTSTSKVDKSSNEVKSTKLPSKQQPKQQSKSTMNDNDGSEEEDEDDEEDDIELSLDDDNNTYNDEDIDGLPTDLSNYQQRIKKGQFMIDLHKHNPEIAIESLLYPLEVDDFFSEYYNQQPLVLEREDETYFNGLFDLGVDFVQELIVREEELNDYNDLMSKWNEIKLNLTQIKELVGLKGEELATLQIALTALDKKTKLNEKSSKMAKNNTKTQPTPQHTELMTKMAQVENELNELLKQQQILTQDKIASEIEKSSIEQPIPFQYGPNQIQISTFGGEYDINLNPDMNPNFIGPIYPAIKARLSLLDSYSRSNEQDDDDTNEMGMGDSDIDNDEKLTKTLKSPLESQITDDDLEAAAIEALEQSVIDNDSDDDDDIMDESELTDEIDLNLIQNYDIFKNKTIEQLYGMIGELYQQKCHIKSQVKPTQIINFLRAGCNIMISQPQQFITPIWRLLYLLETQFQTLISSYIQIIPQYSIGTGKRYSQNGCFMLQLKGTTSFHFHKMKNQHYTEYELEQIQQSTINNQSDVIITQNGPFLQHSQFETDSHHIPQSAHVLNQGDIVYLPPHSIHQIVSTLEPPMIFEDDIEQATKIPFPPTQDTDSIILLLTFPQQAKFSTLLKSAFQSTIEECLTEQPEFNKVLPLHFNTFLGTLHDPNLLSTLDFESNEPQLMIDNEEFNYDEDDDDDEDGEDLDEDDDDDEDEEDNDFVAKSTKTKTKSKTNNNKLSQEQLRQLQDEYNNLSSDDDEMTFNKKFGQKGSKGQKISTSQKVSNEPKMYDDDDNDDEPSLYDDDDNDEFAHLAEEIPPYVMSDYYPHLHRKWLSIGNINPEYRTILKNLRQDNVNTMVQQLLHNFSSRLMSHVHKASDSLHIEFISQRLPPPPIFDHDDDIEQNENDDDDFHENQDGSVDISLDELERLEAMDHTRFDDSDEDEDDDDESSTKSKSMKDNQDDEDNEDEDDEEEYDGSNIIAAAHKLDYNSREQIKTTRSTILTSTIGAINRTDLITQFGESNVQEMIVNFLSTIDENSGVRIAFPENLHFSIEDSQVNDDDEHDDDDDHGSNELIEMEDENEDDEIIQTTEQLQKAIQSIDNEEQNDEDEPLPGEELFPYMCSCQATCDAYQLYCSQISTSVSLAHASKCIAIYNCATNDHETHMGDVKSEEHGIDDLIQFEHNHDDEDDDDVDDCCASGTCENENHDEEDEDQEHDDDCCANGTCSHGHDDDNNEDDEDQLRTELPIAIYPMIQTLKDEYPRLVNIFDLNLDWTAARRTSTGFVTQLPPQLIHLLNNFQMKVDINQDDDEDDDDVEVSERFKMLYRFWAICELFTLGFVEIVPMDVDETNTMLADEGPNDEEDDENDDDDDDDIMATIMKDVKNEANNTQKQSIQPTKLKSIVDKSIKQVTNGTDSKQSKSAMNDFDDDALILSSDDEDNELFEEIDTSEDENMSENEKQMSIDLKKQLQLSAQQRLKQQQLKKYGDSDDEYDIDDEDDDKFGDFDDDGEGEMSLEDLMAIYGGYDGEGENSMLDLLDMDNSEAMDLGSFQFSSFASGLKKRQQYDDEDDDEDDYDDEDDFSDYDEDDFDNEQDEEQRYFRALLHNNDEFSEENSDAIWSDYDDDSEMIDPWGSDDEVQLPPPKPLKGKGIPYEKYSGPLTIEVEENKTKSKMTDNIIKDNKKGNKGNKIVTKELNQGIQTIDQFAKNPKKRQLDTNIQIDDEIKQMNKKAPSTQQPTTTSKSVLKKDTKVDASKSTKSTPTPTKSTTTPKSNNNQKGGNNKQGKK